MGCETLETESAHPRFKGPTGPVYELGGVCACVQVVGCVWPNITVLPTKAQEYTHVCLHSVYM